MELMEEAVNVAVTFRRRAPDVGVKGAVSALAPAEREMEVEVHSFEPGFSFQLRVSSLELIL